MWKEAITFSRALLRVRCLGTPTPLVVGWAVTHRCNRRCQYCAIAHQRGPELTTGQALRVIHELASLGCARVSFTGGEPLLRSDLPILVERLRVVGIAVKINSNGALVPKHVSWLRGIARLTLSLDGSETVHDAIRGGGSYAQVMGAIDAALLNDIPFDLAAVLSRQSLDSVAFLLDKARSLGTTVQFQPATATLLGGAEPNPLCPPVSEYRRVVDYLIAERRKGHPAIPHSVSTLERLRRWPEPQAMRCACGLLSARIQPNGDVVHCSRAIPLRAPMNVGQGAFHAAFRALGPRVCSDCYCASRIELNLLCDLDLGALRNQLRRVEEA